MTAVCHAVLKTFLPVNRPLKKPKMNPNINSPSSSAKRVVEAISVSVEVLGVVGGLDDGVGVEESSGGGLICANMNHCCL